MQMFGIGYLFTQLTIGFYHLSLITLAKFPCRNKDVQWVWSEFMLFAPRYPFIKLPSTFDEPWIKCNPGIKHCRLVVVLYWLIIRQSGVVGITGVITRQTSLLLLGGSRDISWICWRFPFVIALVPQMFLLHMHEKKMLCSLVSVPAVQSKCHGDRWVVSSLPFPDCFFIGSNQISQPTRGLWCLASGSLNHFTGYILSPPVQLQKSRLRPARGCIINHQSLT